MDAHAKAEAVEHRHGREHLVSGTVHRVRRDDLRAERVEVHVRQHDALGLAGRAAGIEDDRGIVAPALHLVVVKAGAGKAHELVPADDGRFLGDFLDLAALGEHIACLERLGERVLHAGNDDVDDLGVAADVLELMVKLVEGDRRHAVRLVEVEFDLLLGGKRMDHVRDRTDEVDGVEHINRLRAVRQGDRDLVVLAYADGLERAGAFLDLPDHFTVAGATPHKGKSRIIRILIGRLFDSVEHRSFKILQM